MVGLKFSAYVLLGLGCLALLAGCDWNRADEVAASNSQETPGLNHSAGGRNIVRAASLDETLPQVDVERLILNQQDYAGTLAVEGVVVQCFEERGAFVVVGLEEFKTCGLDACGDVAMPVRFERDNYEGDMPIPGDFVTLIGDFEPLERGYQFGLHEVHLDDAVILARRADLDDADEPREMMVAPLQEQDHDYAHDHDA